MKIISILTPLTLLFFLNINLYSQSCDCTEYIYLNEISNGGLVHKYAVNPDGSLTEIFNDGGAWYPGAGTSELGNPHGLGTDLNGYLYIAGSYNTTEIRQLDCDGNITPATDYLISNVSEPHYNFMSVDNTLYTNVGEAYDICTGQLIGSVEFCNLSSTASIWGFYYDPVTEYFYVDGSDNGEAHIWRYTIDDYNSGECVPIFVEDTYLESQIPNYNVMRTRGITTDIDGNIYLNIADWDDAGTVNENYALVKLDPNGNFLGYVEDSANDGTGFFLSTGLVYSETSGLLYSSTMSTIDDCISTFDTDLNYLGAAVDPVGDTGQGQIDFNRAKGIAIMQECCPIPSIQTINQVYCVAGMNEELFLNDLFPCDGIICGADWVAADAPSTAIYDDCAQSIIGNAQPGCYSFTKTGSNDQCGAFQVDFNIEILSMPEVTVLGNQTICDADLPTELSATTSAPSIQWQMSTSSCDGPWTDIAGATSTTYTPSNLSETTYYQVIASETANCSTGACDFASECITVTVNQCYDVALTKSVDLTAASLGSPVVFTIVVENLGSAVTGATVNDVLPAGLTYNGIYTASTGTYDGTNWTIGDMAIGQVDSIQITVTADAEGVMTNEAAVTINETETDLTNNEDLACVSVPVQVCDTDAIDVDLTAEPGLNTYQWYKDGVAIAGATNQTYKATEVGTYTYTVDGAGPTGDCEGELCCPILIEQVSCCAPIQCLPVTITKL